jgi:rubrerythrin
MQKITLILTLAILTTLGLLQSCTNNAQPQNEMQQPVALDQNAAGKTDGDKEKEEGSENESMGANTQNGGATSASAVNYQNMQDAFKGETTASAKYAAYSKKAEQEGFHAIAMLFQAASTSEKIHANNHKAVLEDAGQTVASITPDFKVLSTKENLADAIAGETYEITTMYPLFITNANTAKNQLALVSLNYAYKTEQKHKPLYEKALAALESNQVNTLPTVYFVCPTCGNTYDTTSPKRCGISMTSSEKFIKISSLNS